MKTLYRYRKSVILLLHVLGSISTLNSYPIPCAVATWGFGRISIDACSELLINGSSAVDAVEAGINAVETDDQDQYFVGIGGLPNSDGDMELDAAIMDHNSKSAFSFLFIN
jgi:isoaspartyl peptidase/L-asparaginase-like protein (Ntn-hydrolase superfamily)